MRHSTNGFTIIEVLLALLLLSIIILLVLGSFSGLFKLSGNTTRQVNASNRSQAVIEELRGQWMNSNAYDKACVSSGTDLSGVTVSIQEKGIAGGNIGTAYSVVTSTDCTNSGAPAAIGATTSPLKEITVTADIPTGSTTSPSKLILEVARP